jgi:hypothetical protein
MNNILNKFLCNENNAKKRNTLLQALEKPGNANLFTLIPDYRKITVKSSYFLNRIGVEKKRKLSGKVSADLGDGFAG